MATNTQNQPAGLGEKSLKTSKLLKYTKHASSGRQVVAPKRFWTSSDEMPQKKPMKLITSVQKELQALSNVYKDDPKFASVMKSSDKFVSKSHQPKSRPKSNKSSSQILKNHQNPGPSQELNSSKKLLSPKDFPPSAVLPLPVNSKTSNTIKTKTISKSTKQKTDFLPTELHNENEDYSTRAMENYSKLSHKSQEILPAVDSNKKSHAVEQNSKFPQNEPNFDPEVATQAWETNILVPEDVLLEITTRLQNVEEQNREILSIVRDIKEDSNVVKPNSLFAPPQGYPLKTIEEFDSFENDINKVNALYSKLRKYGGTKLREALSFAFKASMTDKLATKFTWYGESGETRNFGKTKMASILYQVVNKCKQFKGPNNSTEFKMEMTEVLRAAKQRHRNFCKKEQRPYKKRSRLDEQQRAHELFDFKENELEDDSNLEEDERSEMDSTNGSYEEDENDPLERELDSAGSFYEGDGEPMENSDERDKTD